MNFIYNSSQFWTEWSSLQGNWNNSHYQELADQLERQGFFIHKIKDASEKTIEELLDFEIFKDWLNLDSQSHIYKVTQHLIENVSQHGSDRGILIASIDENSQELLVSVMDMGRGFAAFDGSDQPTFKLKSNNHLTQRKDSPGWGVALRTVFNLTKRLVILSKCYLWEYGKADIATSY